MIVGGVKKMMVSSRQCLTEVDSTCSQSKNHIPACQTHNCHVFTVQHAVTVPLPESNASLASLFGAPCAYLLLIHRPAHAKCMRAKYMWCLVFDAATPVYLCLRGRSVSVHFFLATDSRWSPADWVSCAPCANAATLTSLVICQWWNGWITLSKGPTCLCYVH